MIQTRTNFKFKLIPYLSYTNTCPWQRIHKTYALNKFFIWQNTIGDGVSTYFTSSFLRLFQKIKQYVAYNINYSSVSTMKMS